MNIENYIDELIDNGLDCNHWFMTKQTMSDFYFPYYVGYVVDTYPKNHRQNQNFADYYMECFKNNPETKDRFSIQWKSENTYRNAIIAEFVGMIDRKTPRYDQAKATNAYRRLSTYVHCVADISHRSSQYIHPNIYSNHQEYHLLQDMYRLNECSSPFDV